MERGCSSLEPTGKRLAVGSVGERQECVLQGGALGPDVLGDEPGAIECEHHGGDKVAGSDDDEIGAVMLDGAHLGERIEDFVTQPIRCPETDSSRG